MLLWLSHLMLAPFELATVSSLCVEFGDLPDEFAALGLPHVARALLGLALHHLYVPGKDREAASMLLVRLALRGDMQRLGLPQTVVNFCFRGLTTPCNNGDQYRYIGLLSLLFGMVNTASSIEAAPFLQQASAISHSLATDTTEHMSAVRTSAPARKAVIKTMRASMLHALYLADSGDDIAQERLNKTLEDGIQVLLEWLSDTDTPVRQAAGKALAVLVLKLDSDMAAEVIEAVTACLNEDVLLEELATGELVTATDLMYVDMTRYRKNVNAVNVLKWHGAMLTLGHLLFRRAPPASQLGPLLEALLMGLKFEQRSNVGTSVGVAVRDAACFGLWSLARKYSTAELNAVRPGSPETSVLQSVANELVTAACCDPSGNLRRGASAALQELIGRHPDAIVDGIAVVQVVDYQAVARRSRAVTEVADGVSRLDSDYRTALMHALLEWRGGRAADSEGRRQAATTIGHLFDTSDLLTKRTFLRVIIDQIQRLKTTNTGVNATTRHGLLLALAAIVVQLHMDSHGAELFDTLTDPVVSVVEQATGDLNGRVSADLINVLEASATVIKALATMVSSCWSAQAQASWSITVFPILERCTTATESAQVIPVAATASRSLYLMLPQAHKLKLLQSWTCKINSATTARVARGRLDTLSALFTHVTDDAELSSHAPVISEYLSSIVVSNLPSELRVAAMENIATILISASMLDHKSQIAFQSALGSGLADYTSDQRGDIGSLLRFASIEALQAAQQNTKLNFDRLVFLPRVVRLAAEKLLKVRFSAWCYLAKNWPKQTDTPSGIHAFRHPADVSSVDYFRQLLALLDIPDLLSDLAVGLAASIGGGTDDVSRAASSALVEYLIDPSAHGREQELHAIIVALSRYVEAHASQNGRDILPAIDTIRLLLEQCSAYLVKEPVTITSSIEAMLNELQRLPGDISKLEAIIRLWATLAEIDGCEVEMLDKCSRKLSHKWPRIRNAAATCLFTLNHMTGLEEVDWNTATAINKAKIVTLRNSLGVANRSS